MKNKLLLLAVVVIVGALLYYCFNTGSKSEDVSAAAGETYKLEYTPTLKTYGFTEPVVLKAKPQRVVSLVHTPVLALHEMGIKQVAVPQAAMLEWPADLVKDAKLLNVSMNSNFDIESVIALEPDLVIVGYQSKDTYGKILDREKIPVYYVDAGHVVSYESIKELTDVLIKAFGQHNAGAEAITDRFNKLEARMAEKRQENKGQKVMVLQSAPPRHYIQGKDGTLGSMLNMLGYENVYQNNKMVLIDLEQALSYEPDLLFCVGGSKTAAEHQQVMEEDFAKNPEYWNNIKAIREREVIYLPIKYVATAGINVIDNMGEDTQKTQDFTEAHPGNTSLHGEYTVNGASGLDELYVKDNDRITVEFKADEDYFLKDVIYNGKSMLGSLKETYASDGSSQGSVSFNINNTSAVQTLEV